MMRFILAGTVVAYGLVAMADEPKPQSGVKAPPYERLLKGDDAKKAEELYGRIGPAEAADKYDEAIALREELLSLRAKLQGADHWETEDAKWDLDAERKIAALSAEQRAGWRKDLQGAEEAMQLDAKGQSAKAQPLLENYRSRCEKIFGEKHPYTTASYNNLAYNLLLRAKYDEAHPLFQKILVLNRELMGEKHPIIALSYNNLADNLNAQSKYAEAQPLYQKALDLNRELLGEKHAHTALAYNNLAGNLDFQGKYADAQPLYQKSLDLNRELLGEKHVSTARSYNNSAGNLNAQGKYADAQPLYQKALDLRRELLGDKHRDVADSYNGLALNLNAHGKYADAQPLYQKALDLRRELFGDKHPITASSYNNLAATLNYQGKYAEAQALFQKALDLYRELLGEKSPHTAQSYGNLATNLSAQKKYSEAQPLFQKALDLYRELLGDKHPHTAKSYGNLAINLNAQGKYAEALPFLQKALDLNRELLGEKHPNTAASYNQLAVNLKDLGKYAEAQLLLQKALDLRRELLGDKHPITASSYNNLAANLNAQGKHAEAQLQLIEAVSAYESSRLGVASRGVDRAVFGAERSPYCLLAATRAHLRTPVAAWVAAETDMARGLSDESASYRGVTLSPDQQKQHATLTQRLNQIQSRIFQLVSNSTPTDLDKAEHIKLREERQNLEAQLSDFAVGMSRREVATLPAVQAAIPAAAALVLWVDLSSHNGDMQEHWGCVVRQTGEPAWERLPGAGPNQIWTTDDSALPAKLREALASGTVSTADLDILTKRLHAQRLAPLAKHLGGVKTLYVIAVNQMAAIPVEVLTGEYAISYVPSGTFLARLQDKAPLSGSALLALGDPVFSRPDAKQKSPTDLPPGGLLILQVTPDGAAAKARLQPGDVLLRYGDTELTTTETLTGAIQAQATAKEVSITVWREGVEKPFTRTVPPGRLGVALSKESAREAIANRRKSDAMLQAVRGGIWKDLPGTRSEVTQIAKLFGPSTTTLLDSEASEQSLDMLRRKGELTKFRYLHFATHGEANNVQTLESVLIMAQDTLPENPLPRVGEPFINGQLSAREVLEFWELNAELVTLSACETAIGRSGGGDGLLGFAQAFLTRGSRSVCLSLWKVDDTATALLMIRFYQNLLGKRDGLTGPMPKAQALAEAKLWLRELAGEEALKLTAAMTNGVVRGTRSKDEDLKLVVPGVDPKQAGTKNVKPFADPRYWAAFILIGDPN